MKYRKMTILCANLFTRVKRYKFITLYTKRHALKDSKFFCTHNIIVGLLYTYSSYSEKLATKVK